MIEQQVGYSMDCIKSIIDQKKRCLDLKANIHERYMTEKYSRMDELVYTSGCSSWFMSQKSGKVWTQWPGNLTDYFWETRKCTKSDYDWI